MALEARLREIANEMTAHGVHYNGSGILIGGAPRRVYRRRKQPPQLAAWTMFLRQFKAAHPEIPARDVRRAASAAFHGAPAQIAPLEYQQPLEALTKQLQNMHLQPTLALPAQTQIVPAEAITPLGSGLMLVRGDLPMHPYAGPHSFGGYGTKSGAMKAVATKRKRGELRSAALKAAKTRQMRY